MCCAFLALVLLGPRFFGAMWWLFQPGQWQLAFNTWFSGGLWWLWAILGIVFLIPWTTIMFVIVAPGPGGVEGWDWLWLGLMLFVDIASYGGGIGRKRIPNYQGY